MFSAWDVINSNRRQNARYKARLMASVSVVAKEAEDSDSSSVLSYTRDLSREGMALVLPSTHMGCHDLSAGDHLLRIVLAIPTGANLSLTARVVHCGLFEDESGTGYLIGVKIEEISAEDHILYDEFITSLH